MTARGLCPVDLCEHGIMTLRGICGRCERDDLQARLDIAIHALQTIADEDYRGNRPASAVVAERVLRLIAPKSAGGVVSEPIKVMSYPVRVNVRDGKPICPCCQEPMQQLADNQWRCALWGPFWDEAAAEVVAAFDRVIEDQPDA